MMKNAQETFCPRVPTQLRVRRRCSNCSRIHEIRGKGYQSTTCIVVGIRTHQNPGLRSPIANVMQPVVSAEHDLGQELWSLFEEEMNKNEAQRKKLQKRHHIPDMRSTSHQKALLREEAPMVWLYWRGADGSKGQTRNARSWKLKWEQLRQSTDRNGQSKPVAWITIDNLDLKRSPITRPLSLEVGGLDAMPISTDSTSDGSSDEDLPRTPSSVTSELVMVRPVQVINDVSMYTRYASLKEWTRLPTPQWDAKREIDRRIAESITEADLFNMRSFGTRRISS